MKPLIPSSFIFFAYLILSAVPSSAQDYDFIDLGTLGGSYSFALCISENGTIAGWATNTAGYKLPVLWIDGVIQSLGPPPGFYGGEAVAVNDHGQVAVKAEGSPQSYTGFFWEDDNYIDLETLPDRNECIPEDIDPYGRIVGSCFNLGAGDAVAFIWESGVMVDLGTLGDSIKAYGINAKGQVVGRCRVELPGGESGYRAFLWENDTMIALAPLAGRDHSQAFDINDLGEVTGSSWYPTGPYSLTVDRATLWRAAGDPIVDLGYTPGPPVCSDNPYYPDNIALAVNNRGQVVGHAQCIASGGSLAGFLWDDGVMYNLNDLTPASIGWDLIKGTDINDSGMIVGFGTPPGGDYELRAFALVPPVTSAGEDATPARSTLLDVYPNPFNPSTKLSFELAAPAHARLMIHDAAGRLVVTLVDEKRSAGHHEVAWSGWDRNGRAVPSGVYFCRFQAGPVTQTRRMTLLK
jgi:probable HAF family extracellular repeat protein